LLEAGAPVDEDHFPNCLSPVAMCSLYGYVSILRQLLSLQKNSAAIKKLVNHSNVESEWSPIMLAAAVGSKPTVQCLLERGADPNSHNRLILQQLLVRSNSVVLNLFVLVTHLFCLKTLAAHLSLIKTKICVLNGHLLRNKYCFYMFSSVFLDLAAHLK
jgi:ankyrin repeat protein